MQEHIDLIFNWQLTVEYASNDCKIPQVMEMIEWGQKSRPKKIPNSKPLFGRNTVLHVL